MASSTHLISLLLAYLLGSFPSSVWIGKLFYKIDVREYGSGNAGATNTFRVLGRKAGIPVLFLDILKGWLAVNIPYVYGDLQPGTSLFVNTQLVLGLAALLGHIFPVFVGFRGGKGIATLLGVVIAMHYEAAMYSIALFLGMLFVSNYVSLSSMSAAVFFAVYISLISVNEHKSLVIFSLFIAILVIITHHKNIKRLLKKEESKVFGNQRNIDEIE